MANATSELLWLRYLKVSLLSPMSPFCDNQAVLHIGLNSVFHECTKHIKIDCHIFCDRILSNKLCTSHVNSSDQVGDLFTKAFGKTQFHHLLSKLVIHNLHAPIRGGVLRYSTIQLCIFSQHICICRDPILGVF